MINFLKKFQQSDFSERSPVLHLLFKISLFLFVVLNLATPFTAQDLSLLIFLDALVVLVTSVSRMGGAFKKVTVVFLALGAGILLYSGQPVSSWIVAAQSMKNVISIVVIMQLFTIPIAIGKYDLAVRYWVQKSVKGETALFFLTTVVTHVFSSILLFGTIPIIVSLLGDTLKRAVSSYERFISSAVSRGYALVVLWSPGSINILLVVQATGVPWIEMLVPGLVLSLIGIATSVFLESKLVLPHNPDTARGPERPSLLTESAARRKTYQIFFAILGLVLITLVLEKLKFGLFSNRVLFAGVIVALIWTSFFVKQPGFKDTLKKYWKNELPKNIDMTPLFLSLGLFSTAIEKAGFIAMIQPDLQVIANSIGIFSLAVLPALMIALAVCGIHPFISIVMIGTVLTSLHLPLSPISLALCLSLGGALSYIFSPFAGIVLTLAKYVNCRTTDITFRWNWVFSSVMFVEGVVFAYLWGKLW